MLQTNADFNEPATNSPEAQPQRAQKKVQCYILRLQELLDDQPVTSREELSTCTNILCELESRGALASEMLDEKLRLQEIWKKRWLAQESINAWMVRHQPGTPIY